MQTTKPLAERMRPHTLDDIVGQPHLVGTQSSLRQMLAKGHIPSLILWGPPGVGKTSLAKVIGGALARPFFTLSAISAGVKDVREVLDKARQAEQGAVLFIDEIHRFNKAQQDALLGAVEQGIITLIGATTENPSFEVISALLSRSQVFVLQPLQDQDMRQLLDNALRRDEILRQLPIALTETEALLRLARGDARRLLNLLEIAVNAADSTQSPMSITDTLVMQAAQSKTVLYDKDGEQHYDIISAFIKSLRGSDPNAAVYYLARMLEGGEDPKFIARRMLILASEDIGNANPTALVLATNTFQAVSVVGMPESRIILAQCAVYLAASPKSNASYTAIEQALDTVRRSGDLAVPLHLRNAPTNLMKNLGYGKEYQYAHNFAGNFAAQEYLPEALANTKFYEPGQNPREAEMRQYLKRCWGDKYNY